MTTEAISVTRTIDAPAEVVFGVLADPTTHAAVDGTGWVGDALDPERLTATGQVFGIAMYHPNHPDGDYRMHNRVEVLEAPRAIAWKPGQYDADGNLGFGGWIWRYDLAPAASGGTEVTLSYDWSAVPARFREVIGFPPFGTDHLTGSLDNLARLATTAAAETR